jgi:hypothetical protein
LPEAKPAEIKRLQGFSGKIAQSVICINDAPAWLALFEWN